MVKITFIAQYWMRCFIWTPYMNCSNWFNRLPERKANTFKVVAAPSSLYHHLHLWGLHTARSLRKTLTGTLISSWNSSRSLCSCAQTYVICHICKHLCVWFCFDEVLMLESLPVDARWCVKQQQILQLWKKSGIFRLFNLCPCSFGALHGSSNVQWWRKIT